MKRIYGIIAILCCICFATAEAQTKMKEISVGAGGGITLSKARLKPTVKQGFKMGATMGARFRYIEEKFFGFQIELNYAQLGWKENFEGEPYSYSRSLHYIQLPFMTHIFFGNDRFRGFFNLGPQVGFFFAEKENANFDPANPPTFENSHITNQYALNVANKIDYGICGGGGIELRMGNHSILAEGRYYFGLGDFFKNRKKDYFTASSNQYISVGLSYLFHLKK